MTEEIIIDGVNVAGCGAYKDKHCKDKTSIMFCDTNLCSNYPYCYYKQLKRLEQENNAYKQSEQEATEIIAELKEYSQRMENQRENYYKEYKKYRSALEEINLILDELKQQYDYMADYSEIKEIQDKIKEVLQ